MDLDLIFTNRFPGILCINKRNTLCLAAQIINHVNLLYPLFVCELNTDGSYSTTLEGSYYDNAVHELDLLAIAPLKRWI